MIVLLGADGARPVYGKTIFVKLLFVVGKELFPELDRKFSFFPSRYGPYTRRFEPNLTKLKKRGVVKEETAPSQTAGGQIRFDYKLSAKGVEEFTDLLRHFQTEEKARIDEYKRTLSNLGYWGLLDYVYGKYPEFTVLSEII